MSSDHEIDRDFRVQAAGDHVPALSKFYAALAARSFSLLLSTVSDLRTPHAVSQRQSKHSPAETPIG